MPRTWVKLRGNGIKDGTRVWARDADASWAPGFFFLSFFPPFLRILFYCTNSFLLLATLNRLRTRRRRQTATITDPRQTPKQSGHTTTMNGGLDKLFTLSISNVYKCMYVCIYIVYDWVHRGFELHVQVQKKTEPAPQVRVRLSGRTAPRTLG
jgi:hypothetical protein